MLVKSLKTDETLYALNAGKLMMPASNMKIVTLAAAAERLGWDYPYETKVVAAGPVAAGVLDGDLVVVGSGDPSLVAADGAGDRVFADWADRLKQRGIRAIAGRVIGDDNAFDDQTLGFGWSWDDLPDDYAAGVGALQFNENAVRVTVAPGPAAGDAAGISITPDGSGLTIVSAVPTRRRGQHFDDRRAPAAGQHGAGAARARSARRRAVGRSPSRSTTRRSSFVNALRTALIAHGIDVRGPAVDVDDVSDARPSADTRRQVQLSYRSAAAHDARAPADEGQPEPVRGDVPEDGRRGGRARPHSGRGPEPRRRRSSKAGASPRCGLIQRDGSGLSRYNLITPEALVTILTHVDRDDRLRGPFEASLPIAGRDGTSVESHERDAGGRQRAGEDRIDVQRARRCQAT